MGKYLELFRGEVGDLTEKTKLENKPYVAYSTKEDKVTYTVVPAKEPVVEGPADNEIWYTTENGEITHMYDVSNLQNQIISNTYVNGKGIFVFENTPIILPRGCFNVGFNNGDFPLLTSIFLPNTIKHIGEISLAEQPLSIINYNGTTTEWNSIEKGYGWNIGVPATVVHCTDGDVTI